MAIEWTKTYRINHQNGSFRIYISKHGRNDYWGAVSYYTTTGIWSSNNLEISSKAEHFTGNGEDVVFETCKSWLTDNLPGQYTIELETN